jgi:transposase InsO family protein
VFGCRFIADELASEHGTPRARAGFSVCAALTGSSRCLLERGDNARGRERPVHDDLVRPDFGASAPSQVWFTDLTEHPTAEGKLYLCCVKDAFSGRIVGYSMEARMKASLAVTALRNAIGLRSPVGTIVHSDRGSQFRSGKFVRLLRSHGLVGSMGRTGTCADNAAMESFFALLQKNVLDQGRWSTREELRLADRDLDRADVPPPAPSARSRQAHADRVRGRARGRSCSLKSVNPASQPRRGQSRRPELARYSGSASVRSTSLTSGRTASGHDH